MAPGQELQVQEKRELQKKGEPTIPARTFVPTTDIYETDQALILVMEMPGVDKANIDISVEMTFSPLLAASTSQNTRSCSRSTPSTSSVTIAEVSACPRAVSIRIRSEPRSTTAC